MLINPSFEQWRSDELNHRGYVFEVETTGGPIVKKYTVDRGEINNPEGWLTWYTHQRTDNPVPWDHNNTIGWAEPESRLSDPTHHRQRSGERAACLFTYRRIHKAGLFQRVKVNKGNKITFSVWAHGWISNSDELPPSCSLPGCEVYAWAENTPGLNDDQRAVLFRVGIDPAGGTDAFAHSVVWGEGWHIFNGYHQLTAEAVAQSETVTVFTCSETLWPVIHNDAYYDDAELIETPAYQSIVNVLPQDISEARAAEIFEDLNLKKQTLTYSFDDAGRVAYNRGDTIYIWDTDQLTYQQIRDWYALHGNQATVIKAGWEPQLYYSQRDSRWNYVPLGNSIYNVGNAGCAVTSVAMLTNHNPGELTDYLNRVSGFTSDGRLYWAKAAIDGLKFIQYHVWDNVKADLEIVKRCLSANPCPVKVDFHPGGKNDSHFVLALEFTEDGKDLYIADPWDGQRKKLLETYAAADWDLARAIYALAEYRKGDVPQEVLNPLSFHVQNDGLSDVMLNYLRVMQPAVIKVFNSGLGKLIKSVSPKTKVVYRHFINNDDIAKIIHDPVNGTAWFFAQLGEDVRARFANGEIDYLETPNNEPNSVGFTTAQWTKADLEFIRQLKVQIPQARPVVATVSVGCPAESDYPALVELARAAQTAGGALGYHAYWPDDANQSYLESDYQWHAGRWEEMDKVLVSAGVAVDWILTESGPCGGVMHPGWFEYDPGAGWKSEKCCNGDWSRTKTELLRFKSMVQEWNKGHGNRCKGFTLFTLCGWDWEYFRLEDAQIADLTG